MIDIPQAVYDFFHKQQFVIVATIDSKGFPHTSCKGIVDIKKEGKIYLFDLYKLHTYNNLKHNPTISLTGVDEENFLGYCIKGYGKIVNLKVKDKDLIDIWNKKLMVRVSKRVLAHIKKDKSSLRQPEAVFPKPQYVIRVEVEEIINLAFHSQ